jgi:hypothetical protein
MIVNKYELVALPGSGVPSKPTRPYVCREVSIHEAHVTDRRFPLNTTFYTAAVGAKHMIEAREQREARPATRDVENGNDDVAVARTQH